MLTLLRTQETANQSDALPNARTDRKNDLLLTSLTPPAARSRKRARKFRLDWYECAMLLLTVSSAAACVLCLGRLGF